ncbi:MAG TPA: hypothetical protein VNT27_02880, partial [Propionibacteriaceae bacterium]|nr:hypothetical protein [Propionibacteriaceae bacterium]
HLAGIQVPDTWTVETVADDRYLLTAPDPAEWFGIGRPYWATLNHSRGMFADSLMLNDDVARVRQAPHEPDVGTLPGT